MKKVSIFVLFFCFALVFAVSACAKVSIKSAESYSANDDYSYIKDIVEKHAKAWINGDISLLSEILHDDVIFAYPGRRLNKSQSIEDLIYFRQHFNYTKVYIHSLIIDGDDFAVEWQFATTEIGSGKRQVVSDAIIGKIQEGKIIVWKEYLDGRVKVLQASGNLSLEEGEEPFPWPKKV